MSSNSPPTDPRVERYSLTLQRFHWVIAVMVISQLGVAVVMTQLRSLEFGKWVIGLHRQIGLLVLALLLIRLAMHRRWAAPRTPIPGIPDWQRRMAGGVHLAFKVLLIAQPILGVFESWARGDSIGLLGLVSISAPFEMSEEWRDRLMHAHVATASVLITLITTHIGAIVFNRYVRNISVIERMLPAAPADKLVNRTPMAVQLTLAFSLLISIMLVTGLYAVFQYRDVTRRNAAFQAGDLAAADSLRAAQVAWKELVGRANAQPVAPADDDLRNLADTARSNLNDAAKHMAPGDLHAALASLLGKVSAATSSGGAWRAADLKAVDSDLQDVVDSEAANIFQQRTENDERTARGHDLLVLAVVPTVVLGLLIAALLSRSINGSLVRMSQLVRAVADGKSDDAVEVVGRGEFSILMHEMLGMRSAVEKRGQAMLAQIQQIESERTRLAEESRAREIAAEARDRSQREQQRRELTQEFENQVAGIVEAVAVTVGNLKDTADRMAASAGTTSKCNREASDKARQTSDSAMAVAPSAAQLSAAASGFREHAESSRTQALQVIAEAAAARTQIETLAGAARQIGSIAEEITAIAQSTSLLAVNARIQAALAGEEGRGFAVVATEVKELAAKTRKAVDGIGGQIEHVTSVANQSGEFLQRVLGRIETLEGAATGICNSADVQCAATVDIAKRIAEIAASTHAVAANIDAAQVTARDTENMAATVVQAADQMSEDALRLQDQVANFVLQIQGVGKPSGASGASMRAGAMEADDHFRRAAQGA